MVITHKIAQCQECDWTDEDYNKAYQKAVYHSRKTGHEVHIETAHLLKIKDGKVRIHNPDDYVELLKKDMNLLQGFIKENQKIFNEYVKKQEEKIKKT